MHFENKSNLKALVVSSLVAFCALVMLIKVVLSIPFWVYLLAAAGGTFYVLKCTDMGKKVSKAASDGLHKAANALDREED